MLAKIAFAVTFMLLLGACSKGGLGSPGSVLWSLTASDAEKAALQDDRAASARFLCAENYSGEGYDACVRNSTKF
jgi:hypothetical protein